MSIANKRNKMTDRNYKHVLKQAEFVFVCA